MEDLIKLTFAYKDSVDFRTYVDSVSRKRTLPVEEVIKLKIVHNYYLYLVEDGRM